MIRTISPVHLIRLERGMAYGAFDVALAAVYDAALAVPGCTHEMAMDAAEVAGGATRMRDGRTLDFPSPYNKKDQANG